MAAFRSGLASQDYPGQWTSCARNPRGHPHWRDLGSAYAACKGAVFSPFSLMLIGLACLAPHLAGVGTGWKVRR
jgi:hypothetical protein